MPTPHLPARHGPAASVVPRLRSSRSSPSSRSLASSSSRRSSSRSSSRTSPRATRPQGDARQGRIQSRSHCAGRSPISRSPIASPDQALFHFDALDVDVSSASLWRRAPVLDAVRLTRPHDHARRATPTARYDIQDLIDALCKPSDGPHAAVLAQQHRDRRRRRLARRPPASGAKSRWRISRSASRSCRACRTTPRSASTRASRARSTAARFTLDGIDVVAVRRPQGSCRSTSTLDALPLPRLRPIRAASAGPEAQGRRADDPAQARVRQRKGRAAHGDAFGHRARRPAGRHAQRRLAAHRRALDRRDARQARSARARGRAGRASPIEAPDVDLRRGADGMLEFQRLLRAGREARGGAAPPPRRRAGAAPWTYSVADASRGRRHGPRRGRRRVIRRFASRSPNVKVDRQQDRVERRRAGAVELAFDSEAGAHFGAHRRRSISRRARHAAISR